MIAVSHHHVKMEERVKMLTTNTPVLVLTDGKEQSVKLVSYIWVS